MPGKCGGRLCKWRRAFGLSLDVQSVIAHPEVAVALPEVTLPDSAFALPALQPLGREVRGGAAAAGRRGIPRASLPAGPRKLLEKTQN